MNTFFHSTVDVVNIEPDFENFERKKWRIQHGGVKCKWKTVYWGIFRVADGKSSQNFPKKMADQKYKKLIDELLKIGTWRFF